MESKLKKIAISFISMIIINILLSSNMFVELGILTPDIGLFYVLGLLFGPYGALGAVSASIIINYLNGLTPQTIIFSAIFSFGISYLAYKLWYSGFKAEKITKPQLNNIYHLGLFLSSIFICGFIYSTIQGDLCSLFIDGTVIEYQFVGYFLNFINISFIFGIIGIWLSEKIDWIETPKTSPRHVNKNIYPTLFILLIIVTIITFFSMALEMSRTLISRELIAIGILLFAYLTKPFEYEVEPTDEHTIIKMIIQNFTFILLSISILGMLISIFSHKVIQNISNANVYLHMMPGLIITDVILLIVLIPGLIILKYIEKKVITPVSSFSEIENFIEENEKIEAEGLLDIYSNYVDEKNEIGTLARSYTKLIQHNNNYIENIHEIEGEKERIKAELDIAHKIQASHLPTKAIETNEFIVNGFSKPAKEVGGDFLDYYNLDEDNIAIMIGDASGKGVPAALLAMNCQIIIKHLIKRDKNPSKTLYILNNLLCENNPESMFITLWLGIYNKTTKKLTFSNAGHNPPLIKENGKFKYLDIDSGIVLGIINDYDYANEEITLNEKLVTYTDGITDANNNLNEMYGEERLLNFFNEFENNEDPIAPLLNDIRKFTKEQEQFDDMTLLYLWIK